MLPNTIFVPCPFASNSLTYQEPNAPDTPTGGAGNPGGPNGPGNVQVDPNDPNAPTATGGGSMFGSDIFLFMALFVGVMLFMSFRKESKARKTQQAMLSSIKQGDQVVTSSGIHATVHRLEDTTVTLLLDSAQVTFERSSIARVVRDSGEAKTA